MLRKDISVLCNIVATGIAVFQAIGEIEGSNANSEVSGFHPVSRTVTLFSLLMCQYIRICL